MRVIRNPYWGTNGHLNSLTIAQIVGSNKKIAFRGNLYGYSFMSTSVFCFSDSPCPKVYSNV